MRPEPTDRSWIVALDRAESQHVGELSSTIRHRIGMAAFRSQEPPCRACALAGKQHMCASPRGPACMPPMRVCLSGDLCVDLEDTNACAGHAPPVPQNQSSGGPAPGAPGSRGEHAMNVVECTIPPNTT